MGKDFFFCEWYRKIVFECSSRLQVSRYTISLDAQPQALQEADQAEFSPKYARHNSELITHHQLTLVSENRVQSLLSLP
jgi:hypothetical protein